MTNQLYCLTCKAITYHTHVEAHKGWFMPSEEWTCRECGNSHLIAREDLPKRPAPVPNTDRMQLRSFACVQFDNEGDE